MSKRYSTEEVVEMLREAVRRERGLNRAAIKLGMTPSHLSNVIRHIKEPGDIVAKRLGLRRVENVYYERIK